MKNGSELDAASAINNRQRFLERHGMDSSQAVVVNVTYDRKDFCQYAEADRSRAAPSDALVTKTPGQGILLPLADCICAVLYDTKQHLLMVSHLGRHSVEQFGGTKSVQYLQSVYGSHPSTLLVWTSPAPNGDRYPLWKFQNQALQAVVRQQCLDAGILPEHIEQSMVDTITDQRYYSHSEFLRGNRAEDGRFAVVAVLLR